MRHFVFAILFLGFIQSAQAGSMKLANDLGFAGMLQMMTSGSKVQLSELSASGKVAHCLQIKRTAQSHGFIKK